jgi:hypothetical protein
VPELPLEKDISEVEIKEAIEKFPRNFSDVYPSSGPAVYPGSLDQAMKQSLFNSDEVSICFVIFILQNQTKTKVLNLISIDFCSHDLY